MNKIKKKLKFIGKKVFGTLIFVAGFTESTTTLGNIMGVNNSDDAFDTSSVTANSDGN